MVFHTSSHEYLWIVNGGQNPEEGMSAHRQPPEQSKAHWNFSPNPQISLEPWGSMHRTCHLSIGAGLNGCSESKFP
jgi:hypothetical protein